MAKVGIHTRRLRRAFDTPLVPGLTHVGYDQFIDATPNGLGPHQHGPAYEICYIKRGTVRWWVGEQSFTIGPGELFMTLPGEVHGGQNGIMDRSELYWVGCVLDPLRGGAGLAGRECALLDRCLRSCRARTCRGDPGLPAHFERVLDQFAAPDQFSQVVIRSSLALLLATVRSCYVRAAEAAQPTLSPRVQAAIAWMQEHLAEPGVLDAVASRAELHESRFRSVFRSETGFSPLEYLTRLRLDRAKELLARPELSVTRIAMDAGFGTSQYFATAFRRLTGFSPRDWRGRAG